ncbi:hypothetical protein [uncultured Megasphaera sp.]|uniref:hypothetical protein n=1 Tax=uncultured Megasphaera sp. TaxID=165188 RepID=UPI00266F0C72|nr:hypothetical protein [uncultured Megasphaera sp.]
MAKIEADLHMISNAAALYAVEPSAYPNFVDDLVKKGSVRLPSIRIYPGIGFPMDVRVDEAIVADGLIVIYGAVRIGFVLCCYIFTLSIHLHVYIVNVIQT